MRCPITPGMVQFEHALARMGPTEPLGWERWPRDVPAQVLGAIASFLLHSMAACQVKSSSAAQRTLGMRRPILRVTRPIRSI